MTKFNQLLFGLMLFTAFTACEKDQNALIIPDNFDGSAYSTHAADEISLRTALSSLSTEMKKGRIAGTSVDPVVLTELYQGGNPSLATVTSDYYKNRIVGAGGWLEELAKASGGSFSPENPQGEGGVYGSNLFDENGLELEQIIEKGLFPAAMYKHATDLMEGPLDVALADRLVAIFGAHPDFPNSDNSSVANPDRFSAQYTARRDKNDGQGFYTQMRQAFIQLQAAIAAGDDYERDQREAIAAIKTNWEKAIIATVINYLHSSISKLSNTNPTENDKASALHSYGEVVGFVHGWRGLAQQHKIITDPEIDELLVLLNAPYDATPTSYTFATDPVNELPKLTEVITKIQGIYSFSDQEIQDFKENWVSKQGR